MRFLLLLLLASICAKGQVFSVYFDTDKSIIKPKYSATLDSAAVAATRAKSTVLISCHCDSRADSAYNYHLSMRRAMAVQAILKQKKVDATLQIVGFGEYKPDFPNTPELMYKNRRCDVKLATSAPVENFTETDAENLVPGALIQLDGLEFVGNQAVPNYYSMPVLYNVLRTMQEHPQLHIFLKGHVCCGDDFPLSVARAKSVYDFLVENKIDTSRLDFAGYSNSMPRVKEVDEATEQQNRRVEMLIVKNGGATGSASTKVESFRVVLREIAFRPNTTYPDKTGDYNLALLAEMIRSSNGYLYVLEVYGINTGLAAQRRTYLDSFFRRKGISKKQMIIIPGTNPAFLKRDILILEVKPLAQ